MKRIEEDLFILRKTDHIPFSPPSTLNTASDANSAGTDQDQKTRGDGGKIILCFTLPVIRVALLAENESNAMVASGFDIVINGVQTRSVISLPTATERMITETNVNLYFLVSFL